MTPCSGPWESWASAEVPGGSLGVSALCEDFGVLSDEMAQRGMEDEVFRIKVAAAGACMPGVSEDSVWSVVGGAGDMSEMPNVVESPRTGSMVGSFRQPWHRRWPRP